MAKATLSDGQFLMLTARRFAAARRTDVSGRTLCAQVDLSDDRSFLSIRHRDLVDLVPDLSIARSEAAGQGWIWVGGEQTSCEIHVVLEALPSALDLILGRCALELIDVAADDGVLPGRACPIRPPDVGDPVGNVIDLGAARDARSGLDD